MPEDMEKIDFNFYVHTKVDTSAEFQLSGLIFIFISCQQLLTVVDNWWQLSQKNFDWDFHLRPKADTCAKFQLSRLFFLFIRCYQLVTADDSFYKQKFKCDIHLPPKADTCAKFQLNRECEVSTYRRTDARTYAKLSGC